MFSLHKILNFFCINHLYREQDKYFKNFIYNFLRLPYLSNINISCRLAEIYCQDPATPVVAAVIPREQVFAALPYHSSLIHCQLVLGG
jgi:hypothetical protein